MINFAKFINEATEKRAITDTTVFAKSFMNYFNKTAGTTYCYIDDMYFTNKYGRMKGSLFISGLSGMRLNFMNGKIHSCSKWTEFMFNKTPTSEFLITSKSKQNRQGLIELCPMMIDWEEYDKVLEDFQTLVHMPNNTYEYDIAVAIVKLVKQFKLTSEKTKQYIIKDLTYFTEEFLDDILNFVEEHKELTTSELVKLIHKEYNETYPEELDVEFTDIPDGLPVGGSDETVEPDESAVRNDEELAAKLIADPLPVFETLNTYVLQIARGIDTALLITGQGGVGKSYNVNRILSAFGTKNKDYVIMKGNSTTAAMYKFLYDNYDKICVFDDCDAILEDTVGLNILKGALDSGDIREISWNTKGADMVDTFGCTTHAEIEERMEEWSAAHKGKTGTPNYFQFQGACIFISNKSVEEIAKLDEAILTRCTQVDINLLASEVIMRMKSVLPSIKVFNARGQDITKEDIKEEVFEYISSETFLKDPRMKGKKISFRLFNNTYKLRYGGSPKWKELAFGCC